LRGVLERFLLGCWIVMALLVLNGFEILDVTTLRVVGVLESRGVFLFTG